MNHASNNDEDDDGWIIPRCACGWEFAPVPGAEDATDVLMDHAYEAGFEAANAEQH